MALQKCGLNINCKNKELQPHGTCSFPCAGYESAHSDALTDFIPWHWHEELEMIFITKGTMKLQVLSETFEVHEGELAIINAKALHCAVGNPYCELQSLVFSPLLITGSLDSAFWNKYIAPIISCTQFSCVILGDSLVSSCFSIAFDALKNDTFAHEFMIREQLSHILLGVYHKLEVYFNTKDKRKNASSDRVAKILDYIQRYYSKNITLADIAEIANISNREVLRCFKRTIGESPMQYILKYRLIQSASMLIEYPEKSISLIAEECGFDSPAYYAKKFKEFYLCTPSEYRKNI